MRCPERQKGQEGFTLVETVVAVLILALGLGAAALTFNMGLRAVDTNRTQMAVMHFARNQLEFLRTLNWTDAALSAGSHTITSGRFPGSYTVSDVSGSLKNISVNVTWPSRMSQGNANTVVTTTFAETLHD